MINKYTISIIMLVGGFCSTLANAAPYIGAGVTVLSGSKITINKNGVTNVLPNIFFGYGSEINKKFHLAGELNYNVVGYGASILPSVMLSERSLAFARVGAIRANFNSNDTSKTRTGGQFGLGIQTNISEKFDVRGEYDYWAFKPFNLGSTHVNSHFNSLSANLIYKFN